MNATDTGANPAPSVAGEATKKESKAPLLQLTIETKDGQKITAFRANIQDVILQKDHRLSLMMILAPSGGLSLDRDVARAGGDMVVGMSAITEMAVNFGIIKHKSKDETAGYRFEVRGLEKKEKVKDDTIRIALEGIGLNNEIDWRLLGDAPTVTAALVVVVKEKSSERFVGFATDVVSLNIKTNEMKVVAKADGNCLASPSALMHTSVAS